MNHDNFWVESKTDSFIEGVQTVLRKIKKLGSQVRVVLLGDIQSKKDVEENGDG